MAERFGERDTAFFHKRKLTGIDRIIGAADTGALNFAENVIRADLRYRRLNNSKVARAEKARGFHFRHCVSFTYCLAFKGRF